MAGLTENAGQSGSCPNGEGFIGASLADDRIRPARFPFYAALRHERPVYFDPKLNMYLVSRYEDVQKVLADPITFSIELGYNSAFASGHQEEFQAILQRDGGGYFRDGIMTDPPVHTRLRKLYETAFTAHRVRSLEPRIRAIISGIIDRAASNGRAEVAGEIAGPITAGVICEQLGLDRDEVDTSTIQRWSLAVVAQLGFLQDREQMLENARTICELQNYLIKQVRAREIEPREDLISDLVHARIGDDANPTLSFEEKVSSARVMLVAGNETTASAITSMFFILATEPEVARKCRDAADDDRLIGRFVEEMLRRDPPVHGRTRVASRDTEVGGVPIPAGAQMLVLFASANDDETQFVCPRRFDIDRPNLGRQVAFGSGAHRCIGAALARSELKVVAQEIVRRLDDIRLDIAIEDIPLTASATDFTIARLPVRFERRG